MNKSMTKSRVEGVGVDKAGVIPAPLDLPSPPQLESSLEEASVIL